MSLIETLEESIRQLRESETSLLRLRADLGSADRLRADNIRLNARCERLEGELIELRERLKVGIHFDHVNPQYRRDFECINPNEPVESA